MTHAEYVDQGYPEMYAVSDVYEDGPEFIVDVYDWSRGGKRERTYSFGTLERAEAKKAELEAEVLEWEVEVNEDDPQGDVERTEMAVLKARMA